MQRSSRYYKLVYNKSILRGKPYGYEPIRIIGDTHGILVDDYYWIRFEGEDLCWDDVKHIKFT